MPKPMNQHGIRRFLGFSNYYRRFVKDYAEKSEPLTRLLKKDCQYHWKTEHDEAFKFLKHAITEDSLLYHPDMNEPFIVHASSTEKGLGAILSQKDDEGDKHPILYASRTLRGAEIRYTSAERDCLAVVYALEQFKPYIYGVPFIVIPNSPAINWLRDSSNPTSKQKKAQLADAFAENPLENDQPEETLLIVCLPATKVSRPNLKPSRTVRNPNLRVRFNSEPEVIQIPVTGSSVAERIKTRRMTDLATGTEESRGSTERPDEVNISLKGEPMEDDVFEEREQLDGLNQGIIESESLMEEQDDDPEELPEDTLTQQLEVQFEYTPGHKGIYGNERADELAKTGSKIYAPT
ncbi:uncharacterized protein LOC135161009 [Diachasmimorpha longicaudata]|uniref:uncharacterized protein LOC135161009 n=1 Tax=Diachasmimorpha longicaudata TaxID=58733 RepID=UPI0030B891CE